MDFAFAPGITAYDQKMRELLERRSSTTLINQPTLTTVADFINHINTSTSVTRPVSNLVIGSHGNDNAWLQIDLDGQLEVNTTYEVLDAADTSDSVNLPSGLVTSGGFFHIKGCRIGQSVPYLQKLKAALGGAVQVTAPKFFHRAGTIPGEGPFEYLCYDFNVSRPTRIANRTALVTALVAAGYSLINGTPVTDAQYTAWIPRRFDFGRITGGTLRSQNITVSGNLSPAVGSIASVRILGEVRYQVKPARFTINRSSAPPAGDTARLALLRAAMLSDPRYQSTHPYPVYARYDFSTLDELLNGFTWTYEWNTALSQLICSGTRHVYTVAPPIVNPANDNLFFNFYPLSTSSATAVTALLETDASLFTTV
jgi:hypothetical protein